MAKFTKGHAFSEDEQLTHTKLNNLVDAAEFASDAVDDSTTELSSGAIIVKTGGVTASQLGASAVITTKILNENVTTGKIADDAVTVDKLAANSVDSDQYVDGSIDKEHLGATVISGQTELTAVPHLTEDFALISDDDVLKKISLMKYLPLPRAWGVIPFSAAGGVTIAGAYNVTTSVTVVSDGDVDTVSVTLSNNMGDTNYLALATLGTSSSSKTDSNPNVNSFNRAAGSFSLGAAIGTDRVLHFIVFGTLG